LGPRINLRPRARDGPRGRAARGGLVGGDGFQIERLRRKSFLSALRVKDAQDFGRLPPAGIFGQM